MSILHCLSRGLAERLLLTFSDVCVAATAPSRRFARRSTPPCPSWSWSCSCRQRSLAHYSLRFTRGAYDLEGSSDLHTCARSLPFSPAARKSQTASLGRAAARSLKIPALSLRRYLLTQMPAGPIVQRFGGKPTMSVCLFGTAACFLAIPGAMATGGIALTSALLGILGLLQGPMSPCQAQVNRDWIPPEGQERSNVLRIQGLAHTSSPMLASIVTPLLARGGWRRVFYVLGGTVGVFSILWHTLVSNRRGGTATATEPASPKAVVGSPARGRPERKELPAAKSPAAKKPLAQGSPEWRIFTLPSVIALIFWQFGSNFLFACLQMLGPTYYTTTLQCSSERAGVLLALAQLTNFPATFFGTSHSRL